MTDRTPQPKMYPNYNKEPREDKTENTDKIDYNGSNTNKTGINQSSVGGNTTNTSTNENKPVYRRPYENFGALFDTEYIPLPPRKKDIKTEEKSNNVNKVKDSYTALGNTVKDSKDKTDTVDKRIEATDQALRPEVDSDMAYDGYRMNELEQRNMKHSAKIHELERELRNVKMENSKIKGQLIGPDAHNGLNEKGGYLDRIPERYETKANSYQDPGYSDAYKTRQEPEPQPAPGRRQYENEQHRVAHRHGGADEEPYWGFNKFYNQQFITSYRRQNVPYYTKLEELEKTHAQPGGIYLIRFHDSGFDEVRLAFREQQTLIKTYEGKVLGIARKHNVYAIEGDADWHYSRNQQHRQQVRINYKSVDDAIATLWFPSRERAEEFCGNHFRNRFQQHNFPTPHSFEAHYIALLAKPFLRDLDTYLVIEVLNAKRYSPDQIQRFDSETREAILQFIPNSIPFVASTIEGHRTLKPGSTALFRDRNSKVFVSLFSSMSEISDLWARGIIQNKLAEWNITGPINVWAFALKDWQD